MNQDYFIKRSRKDLEDELKYLQKRLEMLKDPKYIKRMVKDMIKGVEDSIKEVKKEIKESKK